MPPVIRRGVSLIEVVIVLAITTLLIGLLLPAVQKIRDRAAALQCANNLRQIGLGLESARQTNAGLYPVACRLPQVPLGTTRPSLVDVLGPFVENNGKLFACPKDREAFAHYRTSYEYADEIAGERLETLAILQPTSTIRLAFDISFFHGTPGEPGSRFIVYADGHVE